jgi:hypothetical protein
LHASNLGVPQGMQQVLTGDAAQPDSADQSLVAGSDHNRKLFVEAYVWAVAVDEPQVHHRELVDAERPQVGLDIPAEIGGVDDGQSAAESSRRAPALLTNARFAGYGCRASRMSSLDTFGP